MSKFTPIAAALALALAAPASAQLADGEPLVVATTYQVDSAILEGASRKVTVRLPTGYEEESERRYPVVYLLDGGPEQDFPHIAGIAQSRDMNWSFEPFILVGIESLNRRQELTPPVVDAAAYEETLQATPGGSADYRRFLREELKPLIEASFRTDGHDAIMGESLAGLFVACLVTCN
ncbi:MAG: alpha/beta hydrolase-fold protein, partial [Novosphingobium sp.]